MCAGTKGVVGVGMIPNCRPALGGLAKEGPGGFGGTAGTDSTSPGEVVNSALSEPTAESTEAVSSGVTSVGGRGGAFLWLTGQGSHVRLHMTMISRSGPKSRATAYDASA